MKIHSESRIAHPRSVVFAAYRDRLPEIAAFIPDIQAVNVLARSDAGPLVTLHNEWVSDREVPSYATKLIRPQDLQWDDHASWDASAFVCNYEIKTRVFTEAVRCVGRNTFTEDGDGTKVVLTGDFNITNLKIPGVPSFLAKKMIPKVEQFIVGLITPNLERTNEAVGAFLDAQG